MAFCSFADGAAMFDATPIENLFLLEYMFDAPEQALKVYLYARMLALHPELGGSDSDMAKALRMTEDEVAQAFDYWERRELIERISDQPRSYRFLPQRGSSSGSNLLDQEIYANREFNNRLQKLFEKSLIGQHELNKAADWVNVLHFDKDAVVRLVEYGIETSRVKSPKPQSVFKRLGPWVEELSRQDVHTLAQVEAAIAAESEAMKVAREALRKLGMPRQPSEAELQMVKQWMDDWGYDREAILNACADTVSARNPGMKYLGSILESRRSAESAHYEALTEVLKELNPANPRPSPDQLDRYAALLEEGFAPELIRLAAIHCHRANKDRFDDLEWRLHIWQKDGVSTPEEAEAYMRQMGALSRQLRGLFQIAGFEDRRPGYGALDTYRRWKDAYPGELIEFAAECAKGAGGSMAYMDKLLEGWSQEGVTTVETARARHAAHKAAHAPAAAANPALDYAQREYRDEDFDDGFFVDLNKYAQEEQP